MKTKNVVNFLFGAFFMIQVPNIYSQDENDIIILNTHTNQIVSSIYIKDEILVKYNLPKSLLDKDIFFYIDKEPIMKVKPDGKDSLKVRLKLDTLELNKDKKDTVKVEIGFISKINNKDSILKRKKILIGYIPAVLFSPTSNNINRADIGSKIKVRFLVQPKGENLIYVNELAIGKLEKDTYEKDIYSFVLENKLNKVDSLSEILNPENNKSEVKISLYYGITYETRSLITDNFTVIFGNDRIVRKIIAIIVMGILFVFIIMFLSEKNWQILRDRSDQIIATDKPFSLANTQFAFWTVIILIAYFIIWFQTGGIIQITGQLLGLLGISAGTNLGASLIDKSDISTPGVTRHQDSKTEGFFTDILSDQTGLSIHRLQNVVFTFAIGCYFLYEVFHRYKIPVLDNNLIILMGMSSAAYLAVKSGENKS